MEYIALAIAFIALLASLWSARESYELRKIERGRDVRDADAQRRRLAEGVTAHMAVSEESPDSAKKQWLAQVSNNSGRPITNIILEADMKGTRIVGKAQFLPPGETYFPIEGGRTTTFGFPKPVHELPNSPTPLAAAKRIRVVSLAFTDDAGIPWVRGEDGGLREQTD